MTVLLPVRPDEPLAATLAGALWGGRWAEATDPLGHPVSRHLSFVWQRVSGVPPMVEAQVLPLSLHHLDPAPGWHRTSARLYPLPPVTVRQVGRLRIGTYRPVVLWEVTCHACSFYRPSHTWGAAQRVADRHARRAHPAGTV